MCKICKQNVNIKQIGSLNNQTISYCPYCKSAFIKSDKNERTIISDNVLKVKSNSNKIFIWHCILILLEVICFILIPLKRWIWLVIPCILTIKSLNKYINNNYVFWG